MSLLLWLWLWLWSSAMLPSKPQPNPSSDDRSTLLEFYNSTKGPSWSPVQWDITSDYCSWPGLICNTALNVIKIDLPGNNIEGTLPSSLNLLTMLSHIDLPNNKLYGTIPFFTNLQQLRKLDLSNNKLEGRIPQFLTSPYLLFLDLSNNQLCGGCIPPWPLQRCYLDGPFDCAGCNVTSSTPCNAVCSDGRVLSCSLTARYCQGNPSCKVLVDQQYFFNSEDLTTFYFTNSTIILQRNLSEANLFFIGVRSSIQTDSTSTTVEDSVFFIQTDFPSVEGCLNLSNVTFNFTVTPTTPILINICPNTHPSFSLVSQQPCSSPVSYESLGQLQIMFFSSCSPSSNLSAIYGGLAAVIVFIAILVAVVVVARRNWDLKKQTKDLLSRMQRKK